LTLCMCVLVGAGRKHKLMVQVESAEVSTSESRAQGIVLKVSLPYQMLYQKCHLIEMAI